MINKINLDDSDSHANILHKATMIDIDYSDFNNFYTIMSDFGWYMKTILRTINDTSN